MSTAPGLEENAIVTKVAPRSVADTVSLLTEIVRTKGMKLFAVIDQRASRRRRLD